MTRARLTILMLLLPFCFGAGCQKETRVERQKRPNTIRESVNWLNSGNDLLIHVTKTDQQSHYRGYSIWQLDLKRKVGRKLAIPGGVAEDISPCTKGNCFVLSYSAVPPGWRENKLWQVFTYPVDIAVYQPGDSLWELGLPGLNRFPQHSPTLPQVAFVHLPKSGKEADVAQEMEYGIWVVDLRSGAKRKVFPSAQLNVTDTSLLSSYPYWSPDGKSIALPIITSALGSDSRTTDIFIAASDASSVKRVTSFGDVRSFPLIWTPDNQSVLFVRQADTAKAKPSLWSVNISTGKTVELLSLTRLARKGYFLPSPHGRRVLVASRSEATEDNGVWIIELASGRSRRVLDQSDASLVSWSPDEKRLAVVRYYNEVWIIDAVGNTPPYLAWRIPQE